MCVWRQHQHLGEDRARSWDATDHADGPRVLVESADGAEAHAAWRLLRGQGCRTMWCPGPSSSAAAECLLCRTGRCSLVDDADAVVCSLDLRDEQCAAVVRALDSVAPDKPVVVVAPVERAGPLARELGAARVVPGPLSAEAVLGALARTGWRRPSSVTAGVRSDRPAAPNPGAAAPGARTARGPAPPSAR